MSNVGEAAAAVLASGSVTLLSGLPLSEAEAPGRVRRLAL